MSRFIVLVLLLANAGYFAWSQGQLLRWGMGPATQSEPQHLAQQIHPEALRTARDKEPAAQAPAEVPASGAEDEPVAAIPAPGECLQAGVFDAAQAEAWRAAAAALPQGSWSLERTPIAGRWMVYLGRLADADALAKKRNELRARDVPFDKPSDPALEPGLSLGRFSSEEAAQRARSTLAGQGVRNTRVVQERADAPGFTLRLPAVDGALRGQLEALRPALAGKTLRPCV